MIEGGRAVRSCGLYGRDPVATSIIPTLRQLRIACPNGRALTSICNLERQSAVKDPSRCGWLSEDRLYRSREPPADQACASLGNMGGDNELACDVPLAAGRRWRSRWHNGWLKTSSLKTSSERPQAAAHHLRAKIGAINSIAIASRQGLSQRSRSAICVARRTLTSRESHVHALTDGSLCDRNACWGDHDHRRSPQHRLHQHRKIPTPKYTPGRGPLQQPGSRPPIARTPAKWPATPDVAPDGA